MTVDMDELRQRAAKFMQLEELKDFQSHFRAKENPVQKNENAIITLNIGQARLLEEDLNAKIILTPHRIPTPPNADQSKHCQCHHNYDHNTD